MTVTVIIPTYKLNRNADKSDAQSGSGCDYEYRRAVLERQFHGWIGKLGGASSFLCRI